MNIKKPFLILFCLLLLSCLRQSPREMEAPSDAFPPDIAEFMSLTQAEAMDKLAAEGMRANQILVITELSPISAPEQGLGLDVRAQSIKNAAQMLLAAGAIRKIGEFIGIFRTGSTLKSIFEPFGFTSTWSDVYYSMKTNGPRIKSIINDAFSQKAIEEASTTINASFKNMTPLAPADAAIPTNLAAIPPLEAAFQKTGEYINEPLLADMKSPQFEVTLSKMPSFKETLGYVALGIAIAQGLKSSTKKIIGTLFKTETKSIERFDANSVKALAEANRIPYKVNGKISHSTKNIKGPVILTGFPPIKSPGSAATTRTSGYFHNTVELLTKDGVLLAKAAGSSDLGFGSAAIHTPQGGLLGTLDLTLSGRFQGTGHIGNIKNSAGDVILEVVIPKNGKVIYQEPRTKKIIANSEFESSTQELTTTFQHDLIAERIQPQILATVPGLLLKWFRSVQSP